jgi:hypothetical protein
MSKDSIFTGLPLSALALSPCSASMPETGLEMNTLEPGRWA